MRELISVAFGLSIHHFANVVAHEGKNVPPSDVVDRIKARGYSRIHI